MVGPTLKQSILLRLLIIGEIFVLNIGQSYARLIEESLKSSQNWQDSPDIFLNISEWIKESEHQDFKDKVRELSQVERFGRVLSCLGQCRHFRGQGFTLSRHKSLVQEGDDIETDDRSMAYIYIHGGHLIRMAERTSVSFKEINLTPSEVVVIVRLNYGHIVSMARLAQEIKGDFLPESDRAFIPVRPLEANLLTESVDPLAELFDPEKIMEDYIKKINTKIKQNFETEKHPRNYFLFLVMSNGSLWLESPILEAYVSEGQSSFFKNYPLSFFYNSEQSRQRIHKAVLRGFENLQLEKFEESQWYQFAPDGKSLIAMSEDFASFDLGKMLFQRPWSILHAREYFYEAYDLNQLGQQHFSWKGTQDTSQGGPDAFIRMKQIMDISRRWETYNLPLKFKQQPREDLQQMTSEWLHKLHSLGLEAMAQDMGRGAIHSFRRGRQRLSENKKWWYLEAQLKGQK